MTSATADDPVIFDRVSKEFTRSTGRKRSTRTLVACRDLTFRVHARERVAIVGATGSGKSTALSLLMGLQASTSGTVRVLGCDPHREFDRLRAKLGIVFQTGRLLPWRTALDNVCLGLEILGVGKSERRERAFVWLERLGLGGFSGSYPHELSGGMQQRVAIARTFVTDPELLLADEAFSALDEVTAASVRAQLLELIRDTRKTTVFVTHSISEAVEVGDRVLVLAAPGHVVASISISDFERSDPQARGEAGQRVREALQAASGRGGDEDASAEPDPGIRLDLIDRMTGK